MGSSASEIIEVELARRAGIELDSAHELRPSEGSSARLRLDARGSDVVAASDHPGATKR